MKIDNIGYLNEIEGIYLLKKLYFFPQNNLFESNGTLFQVLKVLKDPSLYLTRLRSFVRF